MEVIKISILGFEVNIFEATFYLLPKLITFFAICSASRSSVWRGQQWLWELQKAIVSQDRMNRRKRELKCWIRKSMASSR